jgi:cell wall-associated NlpC family hydrolase
MPVKPEQIIAEARTWIDTPWRNNQCLKGEGCDCVNLPYAVYQACGFEMPPIPNYHRSPRGEKLLNYLDEYATLIGVTENLYSWSDRYLPKAMSLGDLLAVIGYGDIMVYAREFGGPAGHLAIRTDYGKIEALYGQGVRESGLGNELKLLAGYSLLRR